MDPKKAGVINTPADQADTGARILPDDELKSLRGELEPGEAGFMPLDLDGTPRGASLREKPADDQLVAPVYVPALHPSEELVTPTGAPITSIMNPDHSFVDATLKHRLDSGYAQSPAHKLELERAKELQEKHSRPEQRNIPEVEPSAISASKPKHEPAKAGA
jgi:hypothetical protein